MENLPTNRKEAQQLGAKFYFTGKPCSRGHVSPRKTQGVCVECGREDVRAAADTRRDYFRAYNQREDTQDRKNDWYVQNRDKVMAAAATRPAHIKRQYQEAWKVRNMEAVRADTKSRRRKHRLATPPWLTAVQKKEMRNLYRVAIELTKTTGEQYVVDHIVPLRHPDVCGLHVPWNLRVIPGVENLKKNNRIPDAMLQASFA